MTSPVDNSKALSKRNSRLAGIILLMIAGMVLLSYFTRFILAHVVFKYQ